MKHNRISLDDVEERQKKGVDLAKKLTEFLIMDTDESTDADYDITIIVMAVATFMAGLIETRFEKQQHKGVIDNFNSFINTQIICIEKARKFERSGSV